MEIKKEKQERAYAIKFIAEENGKQVGRAFLYIIYNDLHEEPYGLMEDVFVEEECRGQGIGKQLINLLIQEAKDIGCTKLLATSRHSRIKVHELYESFGFKNHGIEFRMDFKD
jgi:GNAT superfamily N-acetyltransferase